MKHLTFSTKNLLVGDDVADMVVRYAAGLARDGIDPVRIDARPLEHETRGVGARR